MLLAESLLLCGAGAALGVMSAQWMVDVLARYASRFSVRALDLTVDSSLLWVGAALAIVAAVILAFVPRLPSVDTSGALHLSSGSVRMTGSKSRRQRIFVVTQIARIVRAAGRRQHVDHYADRTANGADGYGHAPCPCHQRSRHILRKDAPASGRFLQGIIRRVDALPGVNKTAFGMVAPWRDAGSGPSLQFCADGHDHCRRRRGPSRAVACHLSRILCGAGRSHHRRSRFQ